MSRDPSALKGAFSSEDVWFIADRTLTHLPNTIKTGPVDLLLRLQALKGLPDLGGAPLASWLLARVTRLTAGRTPLPCPLARQNALPICFSLQ